MQTSLSPTHRAVEAHQVAQSRQSRGRAITMVVQGLPWSPNGAEWSPQWSLNGRHWSAKGGTKNKGGKSITQIETECLRRYAYFTGDQWLTTVHLFRWLCRPPSCLAWATCEQPICSKLHGDHAVHGEVWTSYVPPLKDRGNRSASCVPSTPTWPVL